MKFKDIKNLLLGNLVQFGVNNNETEMIATKPKVTGAKALDYAIRVMSRVEKMLDDLEVDTISAIGDDELEVYFVWSDVATALIDALSNFGFKLTVYYNGRAVDKVLYEI